MKAEHSEPNKYVNKKIRFSIKNKILAIAAMAAVPFLILAICIQISMAKYNHAYDEIVDNIAVANAYNLSFKEDMDESLYKIVVGYTTFDTISEEEALKNPYTLITEYRGKCGKLKAATTDAESEVWLDILLRNLDTLEQRVDDLVKTSRVGGNYEKNIKELDNNIYILTELIQEDIQHYIFYQTRSMDVVREQLNEQLKAVITISAVMSVFLVFVVSLLTLRITSSILHPVQDLYQATGRIMQGDFDVRVEDDYGDELGVLARGFNNMTGNIQTLIEQVREDEQKMRRADLRLLQEQINPHFLYNTLDNIVWLIEGNEPEQAVEMVVTLSDFFRVVLSKGKEFISIKQEEQHIRSYLEIQGKRYHDILEYEINIDPALYNYQILKLTLQPLVENSLYHGIKYKRSMGYIHVNGEMEEDRIYLTVCDNGVGMNEEELSELREEISRPCQETEKGFGLANVNERIHMYFGEEYGMSIESEKGKGTTVKITLPAIMAGNGQDERKME